MKLFIHLLYLGVLAQSACLAPALRDSDPETIRFASYNVALFRSAQDGLETDLSSKQDTQIQNIAAVIQEVRPDVLALMEFDHDPSGALLKALQKNYLAIPQQGGEGINYPYAISIPSNTGVLSGHDLNHDGKIALPDDAYGYGAYEGQYAFALLSKYPIDEASIRTLQDFRWSQVPDAKLPMMLSGESYYTDQAWEALRLSSKNHVDIPIKISSKKTVHVILAHPTPPVFDGDEDRNGCRNYDEIRLICDYLSDKDYLNDDQGHAGGLASSSSFVVMGDLNADPLAGDSYTGAIEQLLSHSRINSEAAKGQFIPKNSGGTTAIKRLQKGADPTVATSFFGLRIDYVLPSRDAKVHTSGVFWPGPGEPLYEQVKDRNASDHLLVFADLEF